MASILPSIAGPLAHRLTSLPCAGVVLPYCEDVAFGVGQLGEPTHSWDWLLRHEDFGPQPLRLRHELVDLGHVDVVDRRLAGKHSAHEPAVDTRSSGPSFGIGGDSSDYPILEAFASLRRALPPADVPPEQLAVELRRPLRLIGRNLEVHHCVIHLALSPSDRVLAHSSACD